MSDGTLVRTVAVSYTHLDVYKRQGDLPDHFLRVAVDDFDQVDSCFFVDTEFQRAIGCFDKCTDVFDGLIQLLPIDLDVLSGLVCLCGGTRNFRGWGFMQGYRLSLIHI